MVSCIILARGGSKGIPNKNIIDFCGKPLIAWSILQAKRSFFVDIENVYVSSDSEEILNISKQYGAIPIKRPDHLSTDISTSESALIHYIKFQNLKSEDIVVFLQPTSPLRESRDIDNMVEKMKDFEYDSIFSTVIVKDFCFWKGGRKLKSLYKERKRRQDMDPYFYENGSIYVFKCNPFMESKNRMCGKIGNYVMDDYKIYEIDNYDDLDICKLLFDKHLRRQYE